MDAPLPPPLILHLLIDAHRGGCEVDCLLLCTYAKECDHLVMTLGPAGEMTAPWRQVCMDVQHLDVRHLSRHRLAQRVREAVARLRVVPEVVMLWHGMVEMPFLLHGLRDWRGRVFAHAGNPYVHIHRRTDLRFLAATQIWPSPHRPTFIGCSNYVAHTLDRSWYLRRFPRDAVPNGVLPPSHGLHEPREFGAGDPMRIGMLARLDRIKDHATVLRAVALARAQLPGLELDFVGSGPEREPLEKLAAELGIADAVNFTGSTDDVYAAMRSWDGFVYATTVHEGFGNALAEAMTYGLPTVVTDVGPIREVCGPENIDAAVYVWPGDPEAMARELVRLLPDVARRRALSANARRHALVEFSPSVFARRYAQIFFPTRPGVSDGLPARRRAWVACQIGAREHYAIPRALRRQGQLGLMITDLWWMPGLPAWVERLISRLAPRFRTRWDFRLQAMPRVSFNPTFLLLQAIRRGLPRTWSAHSVFIRFTDWLFQWRAARVVRRWKTNAAPTPVVFSYSYAAGRIFHAAKGRGWITVLGQINPGPREEEIVADLLRREFGPGAALARTPAPYWTRWRRECELADAIIVNSDWSRRLLVEAGVPEEKLEVVPLAYEPPPGSQDYRRDYPRQFSASRPLRVLFLGAANPRKGIHVLLHAARVLAAENAPVKVRIVGRDEMPGGLGDKLPPNTVYHPEVARKDTAAHFLWADVFILPTFSDGFALTLLEAQAWSLPLIASRHCGKVVGHEINGYELDEITTESVAAAIRHCVEDVDRLWEYSRHSVDLNLFSAETIGAQLVEVAERAAARAKPKLSPHVTTA